MTTSPTPQAQTNSRIRKIREIMRTPGDYVLYGLNIALRPYQDAPTRAIINSIVNHYGDTIVIIFPRQSGKDEYLVNLKLYLLDLFSVVPAGIVEVNPTYKPQTVTAMLRFDTALKRHPWTKGKWSKKGDFMRILGQARCAFLSGDVKANVVGATASLVLIINETQDILRSVYDKRFEPMAASTNATRVMAGTVWTSNTLLAQEMRAALEAEKRDGRKRVFIIDTDEVRKYVPWYGAHVDAVVKKLGRQNPLVKTQYFNEEIDAEVGMFNPARRALMLGDQLGQPSPVLGQTYAFLLDIAGQDESRINNADEDAPLSNPGRDAVTLSILSIDLSSLPTLQLPTYRVIHRLSWTGLNHLVIFGKLKALADLWTPQHLVIDATGVGEGLWAMLDRAYPTKVIPIKFSQVVKSEIGWKFITIIETGRFRDCAGSPEVDEQYNHIKSEILPGPAKTLRWSVPEGTRNQATGELIHDDYVMADSLVTALDDLDWYISIPTTLIPGPDPLADIDRKNRP